MRRLVGLRSSDSTVEFQGGGEPSGGGASTTRQVRRRSDQEPRDGRRPAGTSPTARSASGRGRPCAASRSSETARSAPRLVGTRAWTSSTIRCSTRRQCAVPGRLAEQQRKALGRGDEQVRRRVAELPALVGRGVARADADRDGARVEPEPSADRLQRPGEVPLDVVAEAPQRRDVHAPEARPERAGGVLGEEARRGSRGTRRGSCRCPSARSAAGCSPAVDHRPGQHAARGSAPRGTRRRTSRAPGPLRRHGAVPILSWASQHLRGVPIAPRLPGVPPAAAGRPTRGRSGGRQGL